MPTTRNIIIFAGVAIVFILVYVFFIKSSPDDEATLVSSQSTSSTVSSDITVIPNGDSMLASNFLSLLLSVKNIQLDDTILRGSVFSSLHDSSITLTPDGNEGRNNPFAPIGVESAPPMPPAPPATIPDTTTPTIPTTPPATPPAIGIPPAAQI